MPRVVARRLEKLQRDFLWGGGSTERKAHLVNWERVCVGKEKGGLGLRKLVPLNKALLGKWVWRFANAKEEMWKRVLVAKYGQEELGWRTKKVNGAFGVGVWKEIMKEADWCWDKMNFKVGKGTKIRFWKDPWCGEVELAHRFPQLFNVAAQRSATVGELWDYNSDQGSWNLRFSRGFNDWELNMVDELLQIIRSQRIDRVENTLNKRMDGMQNDISQKIDNLQYSISRLTNLNTVQEKGRFPSQPHQNPKGIHEVETHEGESSQVRDVKALITLRSGKKIEQPTPKPHVEKEEEMKKGKEMEDKESEISEEKKDSDSTMNAILEKELMKEEMLRKSTSPPFPQALHGKKGIRNAAEILEVLRQVKVVFS